MSVYKSDNGTELISTRKDIGVLEGIVFDVTDVFRLHKQTSFHDNQAKKDHV